MVIYYSAIFATHTIRLVTQVCWWVQTTSQRCEWRERHDRYDRLGQGDAHCHGAYLAELPWWGRYRLAPEWAHLTPCDALGSASAVVIRESYFRCTWHTARCVCETAVPPSDIIVDLRNVYDPSMQNKKVNTEKFNKNIYYKLLQSLRNLLWCTGLQINKNYQ